ncbi:MAG: O-antigen ligase family protein, partial [Anaerolineae bacterium]|nr:O-antigen ligase family protein [Anaerolineae bacterium]
ALPLTSAIVLIGGVLVVLALLRWHEVALYIAIVAVPFGSLFLIPLGVGNLTAVDIAVALLVALWFARMIVLERGITIRFPPLTLPFALFLFAALISITSALSLQHAIKELTKWLEMFAVYLYVANKIHRAKMTRALAVMFFVGFAEAAIGIYQFFFRWGPKGFLLFGNYLRAFGTFEQPNPFAGYLGLIIPVAFGVVLGALWQFSSFQFSVFRRFQFSVFRRNLQLAILTLLAAFAFVAMLAAAVMSWSRGAWLGIAAGLLVTLVVQSRRALMLTIVAAFVVTFVVLMSSINLIPDVIAARFAGITDYFGVFDVRGVRVDDANYAVVERMAHWQAAWEMWLARPIFGVGIGNYAVVYPAFALPRWDDPLGHAHNYFLNIAAETGTVGLGAYILLWLAAFWQGWRAVRASVGLWRSIAAGLLGTLVALSVHNTFDNLFVHGMAVQVGIGLGMIAVLTKDE